MDQASFRDGSYLVRSAGDSIVSFLVLEDPRFPAFVGFTTLFDIGRLTLSLRTGRALCPAGFFAELFFSLLVLP